MGLASLNMSIFSVLLLLLFSLGLQAPLAQGRPMKRSTTNCANAVMEISPTLDKLIGSSEDPISTEGKEDLRDIKLLKPHLMAFLTALKDASSDVSPIVNNLNILKDCLPETTATESPVIISNPYATWWQLKHFLKRVSRTLSS